MGRCDFLQFGRLQQFKSCRVPRYLRCAIPRHGIHSANTAPFIHIGSGIYTLFIARFQNVTLGGTGKEVGDRHPKLADNVLIGASATVLGNITIGDGAQIAAGSLVLKPVAPHTMVAGSPAKPVGKVRGQQAALSTSDPTHSPARPMHDT